MSVPTCLALSPWLPQRVGSSGVAVRCVLPSSTAKVAGAGTGCAVPSHERTSFPLVNHRAVSSQQVPAPGLSDEVAISSPSDMLIFTWLWCGEELLLLHCLESQGLIFRVGGFFCSPCLSSWLFSGGGLQWWYKTITVSMG